MSKEEQQENNEELQDLWEGIEVEEEEEDISPTELDEEEPEEEEEEPSEQEDLEDSDEEEPETDSEESDEDEEEDIEDEGDLPLVESIRRHLGYDFEEEFPDTEEGIQALVEASANKLADDTIDNIFEQYPDVKELFEYRRLGGDPDQFMNTKFPEVDFSKVEFKEDNVRQHEDLIKQELIEVRGYTAEEADAELKDYKDGGILESKAKRALSTLQAKQKEDKEGLLEKQREQHEKQQQEITQFWENVEDTIKKSNTFKTFNIPSKDKDDFFEYISKPVNNDGLSQRDLDVAEADLETKLAIDYLLYKGFDLTGIIDRRAKDKNAKSLRERMQEAKLGKKKTEQAQPDGELELEELATI